mmetsp:Transcript_90803/g.257223  ORF Transcript_90803/g.257223 Transcript_90803/m.257223 type:complete len:419 (+) Transcript_90803:534-1790(+)
MSGQASSRVAWQAPPPAPSVPLPGGAAAASAPQPHSWSVRRSWRLALAICCITGRISPLLPQREAAPSACMPERPGPLHVELLQRARDGEGVAPHGLAPPAAAHEPGRRPRCCLVVVVVAAPPRPGLAPIDRRRHQGGRAGHAQQPPEEERRAEHRRQGEPDQQLAQVRRVPLVVQRAGVLELVDGAPHVPLLRGIGRVPQEGPDSGTHPYALVVLVARPVQAEVADREHHLLERHPEHLRGWLPGQGGEPPPGEGVDTDAVLDAARAPPPLQEVGLAGPHHLERGLHLHPRDAAVHDTEDVGNGHRGLGDVRAEDRLPHALGRGPEDLLLLLGWNGAVEFHDLIAPQRRVAGEVRSTGRDLLPAGQEDEHAARRPPRRDPLEHGCDQVQRQHMLPERLHRLGRRGHVATLRVRKGSV